MNASQASSTAAWSTGPPVGLAAPHVGEPLTVQDVSWDHGESSVWRVAGPRGVVALKVHGQLRKFEQELRAYGDWLPALARELETRAPGVRTPLLLTHRDQHPRALVLTWEPGAVLEGASVERAEELALHQRAGRFLRALHALPSDDPDPLPLAEAYARRLAAWADRARGLVPAEVIANVTAAVGEALPRLAAEERVPCHRDYTPRNWLAADDGALVVIDFEHARPDLWLADLQRLWVREWRRDPGLREAFLAGYGRDVTPDEEETLRRLAAFWALSTVGWAREHGDDAFEEQGWEVLRWLGLAT